MPAPRRRRPEQAPPSPFFEQVWALVSSVPRGRVLTYGEVARLLGAPRAARAVGWALRALPPRLSRQVPWHRIVGAGGRISLRGGSGEAEQRRRLTREGVRFVSRQVDIARHGLLPKLEAERPRPRVRG